MKWQNACLCKSARGMLLVLGVVVAGATAGAAEKTDKRALISQEARAAGEVARAGGITCSGDATQLLYPLDGSYAPVDFCALPVTPGFDQAMCTGVPPDQHNDDDSSEIPLNFTYSLFGDLYTTLWVNNNGILSFGSFFEEFQPGAFPDPSFPAFVAPFWADADSGQADTVQHGDVWFKQFDSDGNGSDDTLVVTWENIGYYDDHGDLLNTFQVAISDGTNSVMGLGTDVCFSYSNMCWTAGDASGGVGGFGGTPATVGVNRGNGVDFIQAGRFNHAGIDFDGPFGAVDGVSYLDNRVICLSACQTSADCNDNDLCTNDACTAGVCEYTPAVAGTSCGDPTNTDCDNPDTCDGSGACQDNQQAPGSACGSFTDNDCTDPDTCDGAGNCQPNHAPAATACFDPTDTDCDNPDTCDGGGNCLDNLEPNGASCDDLLFCNVNEACQTGSCVGGSPRDCSDGISCTTDTCDEIGNECDNDVDPGFCLVAGACRTDGQENPGNDCEECNPALDPANWSAKAPGTGCGDFSNTDCTDPDTCDGSGSCVGNHVPDDTPCADDGDPATDDLCQSGGCAHPPATGACCGGATGLCSDPVFSADCQGLNEEWTVHATCAEVVCAVIVPPGIDCYRVECNVTEFSFAENPIPADFFAAPGEESPEFAGTVRLSGAGTGDPDYDFAIERLDEMVFDSSLPAERTTAIELVSLNLVSCDPIEVQVSGPGTEIHEWNVRVRLSGSATPPTGTIRAIKEHANGGIFYQTYFAQPVFVFTRVDDPNDIRTFDTGRRGIDPVQFESFEPEPWVHSAAGITVSPCGLKFVPGVQELQVSDGAARGPVPGAKCCVRVKGGKKGKTIKGKTWDCTACPAGACCIADGSGDCMIVTQTSDDRTAKELCELSVGGGGQNGTYMGDYTNCNDSDADGIADVRESDFGNCAAGNLCRTGTSPKTADSDGDGCLDGEELVANTDACDPCSLPAGGCAGTPAVDCDGDGIPDECDFEVAGNDCNNNRTPDQCELTLTGACCTNDACFDGTRTQCETFPGVFQGLCTACPTNLPVANHKGVSIRHFTSRPAACFLSVAARGLEDCSLRTMYYDSWLTNLGGGAQMCHDFSGGGGTSVIPAGYFGPGSDPFTGSICLEGVPLGFISIDVPGGPLVEGEFGDADTMVLRFDDPFDRCDPTSLTGVPVDIQVIALNLTSIGSFTVGFGGGSSSEEWTADVSISDTPIGSLPLGSLTAIKTHCNGGTYNSVLQVLPKFIFTKADDPGVIVELDFGTVAGFGPVQLVQDTNPQWVHEKEGDVALAEDRCTDFKPGVEAVDVQADCDCNANGVRDSCEIESGALGDCNGNGIPDECDISAGETDCDSNGVPDECESDCNANGIADACDIAVGAPDVNGNGVPDECEPDCNGNGVPDGEDLAVGLIPDCQPNGRPDVCDVTSGTSEDCNQDGVPDECEFEDPCPATPVCPVLSAPTMHRIPDVSGTPQDNLKGRFLPVMVSDVGSQSAIEVEFVSLPAPYDLWNGARMYARAPIEICETSTVTTGPCAIDTYTTSMLECTAVPFVTDWSALGVVNVWHEGIVPGGTYNVRVIDATCNPTIEASFSDPTQMQTAVFGDTVGTGGFQYPAGGPPIGVDDALAGIASFSNAPSKPSKSRTELASRCISNTADIDDVLMSLSGFTGGMHPQIPSFPDACASSCSEP